MAIQLQQLLAALDNPLAAHAQVKEYQPLPLGQSPSVGPLEAFLDHALLNDDKAGMDKYSGQRLPRRTFQVHLPDNTIVTLDVGAEIKRRYKAQGWVTTTHQAGHDRNPNASFFWLS
jgi:hypothetical protein